MTIFKLKNFPNVCRLCLQAKSPAELIALDSYRPTFGCSISEMLEEVSLTIPFELACYLPVEVCERCLDEFELFYKYKRKLDLVQRFSCCLAQVKCGDERALTELFDKEKRQLQQLFKDLDLCDREDVGAEEMLEEFDEYDLASTICIKVETVDDDEELDGEVTDLPEIVVEEKLDVPQSFHEHPTDHPEMVVEEKLDEPPSFLGEFQKALEDRHDAAEVHSEVECRSEVVSEVEVPDASATEQGTSEQDEDLKSEYTLIEGVEDDEEYEIDMDDDVDYSADDQPPPQKRRYVRLPEEEVEEQQCSLKCTFKTTFPSQFERHLARVHGDVVEELSCHRMSCAGELFDSIELLRQHKNDAHSTHICMICGKVMKHFIALENHLRSHEREREPTIKCSMCDEMFKSEVEMQRHVTKAHTGRPSFECHECGLGFKHKLLLTQHLLTHSVERNYTCSQCERAFKTSNHLRRHIRTVHAEIRYTCDHCPMTYGRRDKLRMHMERAHDNLCNTVSSDSPVSVKVEDEGSGTNCSNPEENVFVDTVSGTSYFVSDHPGFCSPGESALKTNVEGKVSNFNSSPEQGTSGENLRKITIKSEDTDLNKQPYWSYANVAEESQIPANPERVAEEDDLVVCSPDVLKNILKQSMFGIELLQKAEDMELSLEGQRFITDVVAKHHLSKKRKTTSQLLDYYATVIVTVFTKEQKDTYYISKKGNSGGKLYNRINYILQASSKRIKDKDNRQASSTISETPFTSETLNSISWLQSNRLPWTNVLSHWEISFPDRRPLLCNQKTVPILLKKYPHLKQEFGFQLLDIDYRLLGFGDPFAAQNKWESLLDPIGKYIAKYGKDISVSQLLPVISSAEYSLDSRLLAALRGLSTVLIPVKVNIGFKPTIAAAQSDTFLMVKTKDKAFEALERLRNTWIEQGANATPRLIVLGENTVMACGECIVAYGNIHYTLTSIIRGIDVYAKLSIVLGLPLSKVSKLVWHFILAFLYGAGSTSSYVSVKNLIKFIEAEDC